MAMNTEPVAKPTDIHTIGAALYFLPVQTRVPLKFGAETLTTVTCARARVQVRDRQVVEERVQWVDANCRCPEL